MIPQTMDELFGSAFGLIRGALNSVTYTVGYVFEAIIRLSPLPDEVDFLLFCMLLIWFVSFLIRMMRGKSM